MYPGGSVGRICWYPISLSCLDIFLSAIFRFLHCFQVQWDEPSSIVRPERVSPWELEPLVATNSTNSQPTTQRNKRQRSAVTPSPATDLSALGIFFLFLFGVNVFH